MSFHHDPHQEREKQHIWIDSKLLQDDQTDFHINF